MIFFNLNAAEAADFTEIVSAEINKHIMLCKLFFICQKFCFKAGVLLGGFAARPCARKRIGVKRAVFKLNKCFRRCTCNFNVI